MARRAVSESDLDRLYQLPLGEFIAERNALAKRVGADGADVRGLQKPTLAAWAVNQLYWQDRAAYDDLLARAEDLRATHGAALKGRATDLRGATRAYEDAVEHALRATLARLSASGNPLTDATRQAIATTLRALPSDEAPGRLTRQLQPRGFEILAAPASGGRVRTGSAARPVRTPAPAPGGDRGAKERARKLAAAQQALDAAARASREAEHLARREEFESARTSREAEKAERRVTAAEDALREAQAELEEARRAASVARRAADTAQARASKAAERLREAREREDAARRNVES